MMVVGYCACTITNAHMHTEYHTRVLYISQSHNHTITIRDSVSEVEVSEVHQLHTLSSPLHEPLCNTISNTISNTMTTPVPDT